MESVEILPPKAITTLTPKNTLTKPEEMFVEKALIDDLKASRQDFEIIIDLGKTALENVLDIASQGQHPRFYEAAAMLIKSINEANKERMDIFLKLSQIRKNQSEIKNGPDITVEKGLFVGTTEQLLALVKPRKPNNDISIT